MADEWYLPVVDSESEPYWAGAREGKLMIMRCRACGGNYFYPRRYCPACWSDDTEWLQASGKGTVYTYSIIHQNPAPPFRDMVPYAVVIADLDENVRFTANWARDVDLSKLTVGTRVGVEFEAINERISLPRFRPI